MARRLLILGSTGSIGTQALDVVARSRRPRARRAQRRALVGDARRAGARARRRRGSRWPTPTPPRAPREAWTDGEVLAGAGGARAARHRVRAPTSCSTRSSARPGSGPTVATLGEGIDLALANKESLVVGGELVIAARRGDRRADHARRLRALGAAPAARRASAPGTVDRLVLTASRRPVPRPHARRARGGDRRAGARAPDVGDGRQDHDRLGDADEQGPRADRGPPPVRRRRTSASTSSCTRSRSSTACVAAVRRRARSRTSATRTCACRSPTRCTTPSASTCRRAARPRRRRAR